MALGWRLAYRLGLTPWEWVGGGGSEQLEEVLAREEVRDGRPGRALDIGCGSGSHSLTLARRGWDVTGIDVVPLAIQRARARAASANVAVTFHVADAGTLASLVEPGVLLVLDVGCFHALSDATRDAYAEGVHAVTAPDAALIMMAFQRHGRLTPGPRGATTDDVTRRFPQWTLENEEPARAPLPPPLRALAPRLLTLRRR